MCSCYSNWLHIELIVMMWFKRANTYNSKVHQCIRPSRFQLVLFACTHPLLALDTLRTPRHVIDITNTYEREGARWEPKCQPIRNPNRHCISPELGR